MTGTQHAGRGGPVVAVANQKGGVGKTTVALGIASSAAELALQERDSDQRTAVEFRLREALHGVDGYDLVVIDCPPSVGKLTVNALVAADRLLVVTEPSKVALDGVHQIRATYQTVRRFLNPRLEWAGIVVNLMPARGREAQYRLEELLAAGDVWQPPIPRREIVREALGAAAPLHAYGRDAEAVTAVLDAHTERLLHPAPDLTRPTPEHEAAH